MNGMKLLKKTVVVILSVIIGASAFGCRRGINKINENMEQLTVGIYDAGIGSDWLQSVIDRFMAKYADYTFPSGKTGVEVHIDPSRKYMSETLINGGLYNLNGDVVFAEGTPAAYISNAGITADITDVATAKNYNFITGKSEDLSDAVSIESKLTDEQKEVLTSVDNKYFCLPTTEIYYSIIYDVELFEEENLFFDDSGNFVDRKDAKRSPGPDNDYNTTYDNGLPSTYDQFFKLCDKIAGLAMLPLVWGGTTQNYISSFLLGMAADYQGAEETKLNYSYDGVMKDYITGFDGSGNPIYGTKDIQINAKNGYELYKQTGRYHALDFMDRIISNSSYYDKDETLSQSFSNTDAQSRFVQGKYSKRKKRVAMLIDGTWWQSESKKIFEESVAEHGESASPKNRRFGVMPAPKVSADRLGDPTTILHLTGQTSFISNDTTGITMSIAKEFLRFCYTDESLREFTEVTSMIRPYQFDMGENYNELTGWGKTMYDLHNSAKTVSQDSASQISKLYSSDLWFSERLWLSTINGEGQIFPTTAMKPPSKIGAKEYFNGLSTYWTKAKWESVFSLVCKD